MRKRRRYCGTDILKVVNLHANLKIEFKNIFPKKFLENMILYYIIIKIFNIEEYLYHCHIPSMC